MQCAHCATPVPDEYPAIRAVQPYVDGLSFSAQYEQGVRTLVAALEPDVPSKTGAKNRRGAAARRAGKAPGTRARG